MSRARAGCNDEVREEWLPAGDIPLALPAGAAPPPPPVAVVAVQTGAPALGIPVASGPHAATKV